MTLLDDYGLPQRIDDLAFTGTRQAWGFEQAYTVETLLRLWRPPVFRHGACVGSDERAVMIARATSNRIIAYPGVGAGDDRSDRSAIAIELSTEVMPEERHFPRNRRMVLAGKATLAAVAGTERPEKPMQKNGGTWFTTGFSESIMRVTVIVWPDGSVTWNSDVEHTT